MKSKCIVMLVLSSLVGCGTGLPKDSIPSPSSLKNPLAISHFCKWSADGNLYSQAANEPCGTATSGQSMLGLGKIHGLIVYAPKAGGSATAGKVKLLINGHSTAITCTLGTGAMCGEETHTVEYEDDDLLTVEIDSPVAMNGFTILLGR